MARVLLGQSTALLLVSALSRLAHGKKKKYHSAQLTLVMPAIKPAQWRGRGDYSFPALGKVVATVGYASPSYQTSSNLFFSYGAIGKQLYSSYSPT